MLKITGKENNRILGRQARLIMGSLAAVLLVPSILGFVTNRVCADYREIGGLIRQGSPLAALTGMPFSTLFEVMMLCTIVAIGGVAFVLFILKKPGSRVKAEVKTDCTVDIK